MGRDPSRSISANLRGRANVIFGIISRTPATRLVFCSWWSSADTVNPGVVRLCLRLEVNLIKAVERATDGELLESVDSLTDNVIT